MNERGGINSSGFRRPVCQTGLRGGFREQQVFSAILPFNTPLAQIHAFEPAGIILSGGPSSVYDAQAPLGDPALLGLGIPVLGICYGLQWIAHTLGGDVRASSDRREYGPAELDIQDGSALFAGFPRRLKIWMSHGDHVRALPPGFHITGTTGSSLSAAENTGTSEFLPCNFHPEVLHTERGTDILRNFVFKVCGAKPEWSGSSFIASAVEDIREKIWRRASDMRSERRRGFGGSGGSGPPSHWRPPD